MFAITFDLVVKEVAVQHPKGVTQAYADIGSTLAQHGFQRIQGSVYATKEDGASMVNLVCAINALKALPWFAKSVRDIRAFKIEDWSDFTTMVKSE